LETSTTKLVIYLELPKWLGSNPQVYYSVIVKVNAITGGTLLPLDEVNCKSNWV
jgi:hypothetical protein